MIDDFLTIIITALATLAAVGIPASITFYFKTYLPWRQAQETDQREFTQAERDDLRQHRQGLETEKQKSEILRKSWREDNLAAELERSTEFIREIISAELKEIAKRLWIIQELLEREKKSRD